MRKRNFFCLALLLACWVGVNQTAISQVYQGRELVKAELLADTNAIVPGKPFTAGLLLHMVPHWHTYWKYSGDAGLPTEMKWELPPGWKVGEIQWPIPLRMKDPGDIQTYGYSDEVLLMQQITPPSAINDSTIQLGVTANWLVCERLCIPGSAKLTLSLPKSTSNAPANSEIFARYRALLPQASPSGDSFIKSWVRNGSDVLLTFKNVGPLTKYPFLDLYPLPAGNEVVGHPKVETRAADEVTFRIPFENSPPDRIRGVIVAGQNATDEHRIGWTFAGEMKTVAAAAPVASRGLLGFLFLGFLGGFILNLMPCVLPVISLKIFGFVQQAGQDRRKVLQSGLAFIAGIFVWFIGLALLLVALKAAGHQITWAAQFTNPYFVLFLGVIVLVFALNLFGVFEISPPQAVMRVAGEAGHGNAGSFFQGVFATVLATPCTAPFLGTALGFAFTQSAAVILAMFVAIAAGMSAPYFLLSVQPAWLRFLPKPGPWMEHVKQLMGFLLLATLLFLLYVLGAQRGTDAIIWASSFLLIISLACWMKGRFILPSASLTTRAVVLVLILVLVIGSGFYFVGQKFRLAQLSPAQTQSAGEWQPFTPERLESELAQGRSVFVDFTAAWCITCKFNEATVLESGPVRDAFRRNGIVKLKADWTNADPAITKILKQFGRPGVPFYVLYPAGRSPITFPELLTKGIVLEKLETIAPHVAAQ
jgi:thiol:disulfide interchange protein/DsbC/DsbD-like thiol-disulfide interchange protein